MGFFDIFRKKKVSAEIKEISLDDLEAEAKGFIKRSEEIERELMNSAFRMRKDFNKDFVDKISTLRGLDLEKRKEDLRLKERVLEGKDSYVNHSERLVEKILELKGDSFEGYFKELDRLVSRFEKDSIKSYSVANILIGEELAEVRKTIRDFFKLNEKVFFDNKDVFSRRRSFEILLEKYNSFKDSIKLRKDMESELKSIDKEICGKRIILKNMEGEFSEFKRSERFKNLVEEEKKREKERRALFNQAEILKERIDFKELLGIHHKNEKMKTLLRDYKDNFVRALIEDSQKVFLDVFDKNLAKEMEEIKTALSNLDKEVFSEVIEEKNSFERNIEHILSEISSLEARKESSEKLLGKLRVREEDKLEELKVDLKKLGFHLSD